MLIEKQTKSDIDSSLIKDIIRSFNNYHEINNYREDVGNNSLTELWDLLPTEELYTVVKDNRFLGFFINPSHRTNKEISLQIFLSPLACPKSNLSLLKAAIANAFILFLNQKEDYQYFEFISGHPLMVTTVKSMIPKIKAYSINPNHIVCYKEIEDNDLNYMNSFINTYIQTDNKNYNSYVFKK